MTPDQELYELEQLNQSIDETIAENIKCQTQSQANENNTANTSNDKWYKFNDTSVEEINFTDANFTFTISQNNNSNNNVTSSKALTK
jgi:hypothetical protein